jgi:hypothetical protein
MSFLPSRGATTHGQPTEIKTKEVYPVTYLRFTRPEYRAIAAACRSVPLSDDFFPRFKYFLVEALFDSFPDLAQRIALFRTCQLGILFEYLKDQRAAAALRQGQATTPEATQGHLTVEELQTIVRVSRPLWRPDGSPPSIGAFLVHLVGEVSPDLARKLACFSDRQMKRLFQRVKERRWRA